MKITKATGTIHLKSGFHYTGRILVANTGWLVFYDDKTTKSIKIRTDSVDHFVPLEGGD